MRDAILTHLALGERVAVSTQKQDLATVLTLHSVQGKPSQGVAQISRYAARFLTIARLTVFNRFFIPKDKLPKAVTPDRTIPR